MNLNSSTSPLYLVYIPCTPLVAKSYYHPLPINHCNLSFCIIVSSISCVWTIFLLWIKHTGWIHGTMNIKRRRMWFTYNSFLASIINNTEKYLQGNWEVSLPLYKTLQHNYKNQHTTIHPKYKHKKTAATNMKTPDQ